jgi:hypothetical protein
MPAYVALQTIPCETRRKIHVCRHPEASPSDPFENREVLKMKIQNETIFSIAARRLGALDVSSQLFNYSAIFNAEHAKTDCRELGP